MARVGVACLALAALSPDALTLVAGWADWAGNWAAISPSGACAMELLINRIGGVY